MGAAVEEPQGTTESSCGTCSLTLHQIRNEERRLRKLSPSVA